MVCLVTAVSIPTSRVDWPSILWRILPWNPEIGDAVQATEYRQLRFEDFDSFVDTARSFDWSPVQLSAGNLNLVFDSFDAGDFGAFRLQFAPRVHDRSVTRRGFVSFSLIKGECTSVGSLVPSGTLCVMLDTREYRSTFEKGFTCLEFYCHRSVLGRHPLGELVMNRNHAHDELFFALDAVSFHRLWRILDDLINGDHLFLEPNTRAATGQAILGQLYRSIAPRLGAAIQSIPTVPRATVAYDALAAIDVFGHETDVESLAQRIGVGRRALELSFQSVLGVSPGQFLLAHRLTRVRDQLVRGRENVTFAALDQGFSHAGRFSGQYRRLFGELPSDTLRRAGN